MRRFRGQFLITVTDGAPRNQYDSRAYGFSSTDEYSRARHDELRRALDCAGFTGRAEEFGIPDQEASFHLAELVGRLYDLLRKAQPECVFTHPYEGGHPDHDACAFVVHRAVARLAVRTGRAPMIIECAFYHAGAESAEPGGFLPAPGETREIVHVLTPAERAIKREMIECFATQRNTLGNLASDCERFRIAPEYDFHTQPHPGRLLYESYDWGMTAARFCQLAQKADMELSAESATTCG
jgi:LmbE family N-acetylglucosaminyl deacetylase